MSERRSLNDAFRLGFRPVYRCPLVMSQFARLKTWAHAIKWDLLALYLAARDPRVPWYAKVTAACVAAYALSPIDLIPDFIPVIGYLDDAIIVPVGILLAVRMIPDAIMAEHRASAVSARGRPASKAGATAIVAIWGAAIALAAWFAWGYFSA